MALSEKTEGGGNYNNIFLTPIGTENGVRWARRVNSPDVPKAVKREAKCGIVYELYYEGVEGVIESIRIVSKEFNEELEIGMTDGEERYFLQTSFTSEIGKAFIVRMNNMLKGAAVKVVVGTIREDNRRFLYIKQDGEKLPNAYRRDNPEGLTLPEPVKKEGRGGKVSWDWEAHEDGLFDVCRKAAVSIGWATEENFETSAMERKGGDDKEEAEAGADDTTPPVTDDEVPPTEPDSLIGVDEEDIPF